MRKALMTWTGVAIAVMLAGTAWAAFNYFQGFEVDTGDWVVSAPWGQALNQVPSFGGALGLPAASGGYYAETVNLADGYATYFGNGGYSFYGGKDSTYHGDFYQSIDVYIDVSWALPVKYPTLAGFWIDMTPYHGDPNNYGAEHNFQIKALGGSVAVYVDGQASPIATLTESGWYTFLMTFRRAANLSDPVITDMNVYNSSHTLMGTTLVYAISPGGPFASSDLRGNGYVWVTVWQNGFADDVLGLDNQRTGLLPWLPVPATKDQCKADGWRSLSRTDSTTFKNQGDCIQYQ